MYLPHPIDPRRKRVDAVGIEVLALLRAEISESLVDAPRLLVRSLGDERVEHVGDGHDASDDGNVLAVQSRRIA